jgi:hypothetical protein
MTDTAKKDEVVVTDIRMPFGSMVVFMVKWAVAAIPAFVILVLVGGMVWSLLVSVLLSGVIGSRSSSPASSQTSLATTLSSESGAYLSKVEVVGVQVSDVSTGKAVSGEVKNKGDRSLSRVDVTVYCLGSDGKPMFETTHYPVLVSSLSLGNDSAPLKPGYGRKFRYILDDVPSGWSGDVNVKVTAVEFSDK